MSIISQMNPAPSKDNLFISKFGIIVAVVFTVLQLVNISVMANFDTWVSLSVFTVSILRIIYLVRFCDLSMNPARVLLWFAWDFSMVVLPVLLFGLYEGMYYSAASLLIGKEDIGFTINIGAAVLLVHFCLSIGWKNKLETSDRYMPSFSNGKFVMASFLFLVLILGSLFVAKYFGTGTLGVEINRLPFKLSGIINFFAYFFPFFYFLFLADNFIKRGVPLFILVAIVLLITGLQMYISLSKASVALGFLVTGIYLVFSKRVLGRSMVFIALLGAMGLFVGSYVSSYRASLNEFRALSASEIEADYSLIDYVHRIFREGVLFQKFHAYASVSTLPEDLAFADYNPSDLHTYLIDKTPLTSVHSSGCSTLVSLYCFGMKYIFLGAAFMSLSCVFLDYGLPRRRGFWGSSICRAFVVYYVVVFLYYLAAVQLIAALFMRAAFSPNVIFPILLLGCFYIYIRFFCKLLPPSPSNPPGGPCYPRPEMRPRPELHGARRGA